MNATTDSFEDLKRNYVYDPILETNPKRFTLFPIQYPHLWDKYKESLSSIWFSEDIKLEKEDKTQFSTLLTEKEQECIILLLECLRCSNDILIKDFIVDFTNDVQIPESRCFFGFQLTRDNEHFELLSLLHNFFSLKDETIASVMMTTTTPPRRNASSYMELKKNWVSTYHQHSSDKDDDDNKKLTFPTRLLISIIIRKIFFTSCFCLIDIFKEILPNSFSTSINNIRNDHTRFNEYVYLLYSTYLKNPVDYNTLTEMINEAISIEKLFVINISSIYRRSKEDKSDIRSNPHLLCEYIEYVADDLIISLGYNKKFYNTPNPFQSMKTTNIPSYSSSSFPFISSLQSKKRYFETKEHVNEDDDIFTTDADF